MFNSGTILRSTDINDPTDPDRVGSGNNTATTSGLVISPSDLLFSKTSDRGAYVSGDIIVYTLFYHNSGTDTLPITITDILPAGVTGRTVST